MWRFYEDVGQTAWFGHGARFLSWMKDFAPEFRRSSGTIKSTDLQKISWQFVILLNLGTTYADDRWYAMHVKKTVAPEDTRNLSGVERLGKGRHKMFCNN